MNITKNRIRELRIKNKLTLDDVARHLDVGRQAIYKYEKGTVTNIPLENLEKMAELFGVSPGYLAGWVDDDAQKEMDNLIESINSAVPQTSEARILARNIDRMPEDDRKKAMALLSVAFSDFFKEDSK